MPAEHIYDAIILGAGFGGLGQGAALMRTGIDNFLILEQAGDLGGVWRDNTYPGAACDTQTPIYCYSYYLHLSARRMFARQGELLEYLRAFAREYSLTARIRFHHRVTSARWSEADRLWTIQTATATTVRCRTFIPAWGQLSTPYIPPLPGLSSFNGTWFHSARWQHDLDLTGQKVASVGNAATAVQYIPELAPIVDRLLVFQRSANYILPRNQHTFTAAERHDFLTDPDSYRSLRTNIHRDREEGFARSKLNTTEAERGATEARRHLYHQITDPNLRRKLWPDYAFGCKRILRSDDYYPTFARENVELVTEPIESVTPTGLRTMDGQRYDVDVIVLATGFESHAFHGDIIISGLGGHTLSERWGDTPEAYLGMCVDGFPNMFMIYGPNTNLNHNSVVSMLEAQHAYIAQCVHHLINAPGQSLHVRAEVVQQYNVRIQDELKKTAYAAECSSWYKNAAGTVINNWCGTVDEYQAQTRILNYTDYEPST